MSATLATLLLALAPGEPAPATAPALPVVRDDEEAPDELAEHAALLAKLGKLKGSSRAAFFEAFHEELGKLGGAPQVTLAAKLAEGIDVDALPAATDFAPHDPERWVRKAPRRRRVKEGSSRWKKLHRRIADEHPPRRLEAGVVYEFGSGRIVRVAEKDDPEREFRNLLRGLAPLQDVAEAVVLAKLDGDDGMRKEAEFFSHPYADRKGNYYDGIALYDVWSREVPNEVPDVDARAYASKVHGDDSVPDPLRARDQQRWYGRMYESAKELAKRIRTGRTLAAAWVQADPQLESGYSASLSYVHAYIATGDEDSGAVAERFQAEGYDFLENVRNEIESGGSDAYGPGTQRQEAFRKGSERIVQAALAAAEARGLR